MTGNLRVDQLRDAVAEISGIKLDVVVHETIDSTNTWSLQQCRQGRVLPFSCLAEEQTSGKGRRGKSWIMSPQRNIAMSLCWPFALSSQQLLLLPLSIALAIVKTLEIIKLKHVQIKWPNDVYVRDKKIAGVLIETRLIPDKLPGDVIDNGATESVSAGSGDSSATQRNSHMAVIIGVGLNFDMSALGANLEAGSARPGFEFTDIQREMSLQNIDSGVDSEVVDREQVTSILLQNLVETCQNFQKNSLQNLEAFRASYDYCESKTVDIVLDDQRVLSGIANGVNSAAELLVMIDGEERTFNSADVSVRAIDKVKAIENCKS